ncbi:MAG: hypothetical protein K0S56_310 [Microvirga sp.]|nr:hypothetical protein [Microvirga sp.]
MRTALLSLPFVLAAMPALAQDMPNSLDMTCAAASALVQERGQVVMATGSDFQRLVSGPGYCDAQHSATPRWIRTSDQSQCLVGYYCRDRMDESR